MSIAILLGQFIMTVRQKIQVIKNPYIRRSLPMEQPKTLTYQKATGAIRFKMVNDYMFRYILQKNQKVLRGLICALLHLKPSDIKKIEIKNPINLTDDITGKEFIMDIHIILNDDTFLNLEMQVVNTGDWPERSLGYLCRGYDNLRKGQKYEETMPVIHIGFVDFTPFPEVPEFYSKYLLINVKNNHVYTDKFVMRVVNLKRVDLATDEDKAFQIDLNENSSSEDSRPKENKRDKKIPQKGDPYREKLILKCYYINASNYRLVGIFDELKKVKVKSCINLVAASIRIFLDLAIVEYVEANGLRRDFEEECNLSFREIPLKKRLNCLEKRLSKYPEAKKILIQLKSNDARYTLDILNGYQHSLSTAHLVPEYVNGFWDFLFPLFCTLLDIKEK